MNVATVALLPAAAALMRADAMRVLVLLRPTMARFAPRAARRLLGRSIKMADRKDDPKSSEWRPYIFASDQWHCRICGDRFLYSEMVRKHIANEHNETIPPSMYEYFQGAVWQRKKLP